jgi:hypothetical protein
VTLPNLRIIYCGLNDRRRDCEFPSSRYTADNPGGDRVSVTWRKTDRPITDGERVKALEWEK